jgi:hypothetical protein
MLCFFLNGKAQISDSTDPNFPHSIMTSSHFAEAFQPSNLVAVIQTENNLQHIDIEKELFPAFTWGNNHQIRKEYGIPTANPMFMI